MCHFLAKYIANSFFYDQLGGDLFIFLKGTAEV
jgi:hypothetical protein